MGFFGRLFRPRAHDAKPIEGAQPIDDATMAEVRRLAAQGKKIEAIKVYRAATNAGLRDAKDVVERINDGRY